MVAPSFESYKKVTEPYSKNGKMYIDVEHPNTHNVRSVRFYTEAEFAKLYGKKLGIAPVPQFNQRKVLGFGNDGYITIFKGVTAAHEDFFNKSNARFCNLWGWYVPYTEDIPENLPEGIIPVRIGWSMVKENDSEVMKDTNKLQAIIRELFREVCA